MNAQAVIAKSAINAAEQAGPDGIVKLIIRLDDVLLPPEEIALLRELGMTTWMPLAKQAFLALPARHLLSVSELPSVIQVLGVGSAQKESG